jgi:phosphatidylserine decarboxylase
LSPGDYHRYHSAAISYANFRRHIAGKLSPVKPSYVANHPNVFKENERVSVTGGWANGFYSTTFIGATNVGSIVLNFDDSLKTNSMLLTGNAVSDRAYCPIKSVNFNSKFRSDKLSEDLSHDVTSSCDVSGDTSDNEDLSDDLKATLDSSPKDPFREESTEAGELSSNPDQDCLDIIEAENQRYLVTEKGILLEKGQEMGYFKMGSSIMLIFETPEESSFGVEVGQKVKLGENILSSF